MSKLLGGWVIAAAIVVVAPLAQAGVTAGCPDGAVAAGSFASANLGAVAGKCGSVSAGGNAVNVSAPVGAPGVFVEQWLGVLLDNGDFQGNTASALKFDNFQAVLGSTITFNWFATFEPGSEGYVFAILDGQMTILQQQFLSQPAVTLNIAPANTELSVGSSGFHSLALGVVEGCTGLNCIGNRTLDPAATFSEITLSDPLSAPEPATMSLFGLGFAAIVLGAVRKKR